MLRALDGASRTSIISNYCEDITSMIASNDRAGITPDKTE